ncbi:MAG: YdiU family protein [Pseudomonadota bacterium]
MTSAPIAFDNSYARFPERFYSRQAPSPVEAPELIALNEPLAQFLGLDIDWLRSDTGIAMLSGNAFPEGAAGIAQAYAGHQFGSWNPQLGDGRAVMIGEVIAEDGHRYDIQLKGSGQTPFSRMGDGRSALGPALREYIMSEAMHTLGVPTTRALAVLSTGETVLRQNGPEPGGIVVRVASSHVRVGTFQYFYAREDREAVRLLVDHCLERHYPDRDGTKGLLEGVIERQAKLIAQWLHLGFIHGVMNTDNMTVSGETIDYGPCAFLDDYNPGKVFSSIDQTGRYAFGNQPYIGQWNLGQFAQTLLPLLDDDQDKAIEIAKEVLSVFPDTFGEAYETGLRAKLGLAAERPEDMALAQDLLRAMVMQQADYTRVFRALSNLTSGDETGEEQFLSEFADGNSVGMWLISWRQRLAHETASDDERQAAMKRIHPMIIPRNHRVEEAIAAAYAEDFSVFERLNAALQKPFDDLPLNDPYALAPEPEEIVQATFCGT